MDDINNLWKNHSTAIIIGVIIAVIGSTIELIFKNFIGAFLVLVSVLLILHSLRIKKKEAGDSSYFIPSEKFRIGSAISAIVVMLAAIIVLIIPSSGDAIQEYYFGTQTPVPTVTPSETVFVTEETPPPQKPTIPPTEILTIPPTEFAPSINFTNSCISKLWIPWENDVRSTPTTTRTPSPNSCWNFSDQGLFADDTGLWIYQYADNSNESFGMLTDLPKNTFKFSISLIINNLSIEEDFSNSDFFIGFVDSTSNDFSGKYLFFRAYRTGFYPWLLSGDYFPVEAKRIFEKQLNQMGNEIIIEGLRTGLTMNLSVKGIRSDSNIEEFEFLNKWDKLLIGYQLAKGGLLDIKITNLELLEQ